MRPFQILLDTLAPLGLDDGAATLRDATRLALQSGLAAVATYFAIGAIGSDEYFVAILSAVLILQPSFGGTIDAARTRVAATAVGSAIGLLCLFTLPPGWGAALGLMVTMVVLNAFAQLKPEWGYGVVAAVALSISTSDDLTSAAAARLLAIVIGVAVGLLTSMIVWPESATTRFERHLSAALRRMAEALGETVGKVTEDRPATDLPAIDRARDALAKAREAQAAAKLADHTSMSRRLRAAQDTLDAIGLVNTILSRTGDMRGSPLEGPVEPLRQKGCAILTALADGAAPLLTMDDFDAATRQLEAALDGPVWTDRRGGNQAQVILFACGTLRDQMKALIETRPHPATVAPPWAERVSRRRT